MNDYTKNCILHCDLNNFYASVECLLNPELKNVPMAVTGDVDKRHGIVLAKNQLAKQKGVVTAEVIWKAVQKAPDLVCVKPHFSLYSKYSKQIFDLYTTFTPQVESFGPDECWLDVSGCGLDPVLLANTIRKTVKKETGLTVSVGVSFNKIFAKMGSDYKKPDATTLISHENFRRMLWGLPAGELFMVGKQTAQKMRALNILTIGDIANSDLELMRNMFGIMGIKHRENARGENTERVKYATEEREEKSIGHGMTAVKDITDLSTAKTLIFSLCDKISERLFKRGLKCQGVSLHLRTSDLKSYSRQKKLSYPTSTATLIAAAAIELISEHWKVGKPLRTITVNAFDLTKKDEPRQMDMFTQENATNLKKDNLDKALKKIRCKYGSSSIERANLLNNEFLYEKSADSSDDNSYDD